MSKTIQIRNVPDPVHRTLKSRAAEAGVTLSDCLLAEIQKLAELPTVATLTKRVRQRTRTAIKRSSAAAIRRQRDARSV